MDFKILLMNNPSSTGLQTQNKDDILSIDWDYGSIILSKHLLGNILIEIRKTLLPDDILSTGK